MWLPFGNNNCLIENIYHELRILLRKKWQRSSVRRPFASKKIVGATRFCVEKKIVGATAFCVAKMAEIVGATRFCVENIFGATRFCVENMAEIVGATRFCVVKIVGATRFCVENMAEIVSATNFLRRKNRRCDDFLRRKNGRDRRCDEILWWLLCIHLFLKKLNKTLQ